MKKTLIINVLLLINSVFGCTNKFNGRPVTAAGDFNSIAQWNAADSHGTMGFDDLKCVYKVTYGGLLPNNNYKWKVTIDNSWKESYGCGNADCFFKTNSNGEITLIFDPQFNRLSFDSIVNQIEINYIFPPAPCVDKFDGKDVRATGDWGAPIPWNEYEPFGKMTLDSANCQYSVVVSRLKASTKYFWKVVINNDWKQNYGLNGVLNVEKANADFITSAEGKVRLIFKLNPINLLSDYSFDVTEPSVTLATTTTSSGGGIGSSTGNIVNPITTPKPVVTIPNAVNPTKPCTNLCPTCNNNFQSKVVRATGDWTTDLGALKPWDATEPLGLMEYDLEICAYTLVIKNLKPSFDYKWKVVINNAWAENYGCGGSGDCTFKSNSKGAIRFVFKSSPIQLTTDYNVAPCNDGICEEGETCRACPADCGVCPPPVCGDGICEEGESYLTCSNDCSNELPGCERFNDESCKSGSQFSANDGLDKRRWQSPKPGAKNYQPSYQDYHSLVGYADIRYTSTSRTEADVCIIATHRSKEVTLQYYFNDEAQSSNCKKFSSSHKSTVQLRVTGSDGTKLTIHEVTLYWNRATLANRPGDYRNGQKGAVAEFFGWPHKDVEKECEILAKAGYLGAKLFPVHEQLMSTQPFENTMNPWYFMYQPVSYKLDGRAGTREELQSLIDKCRSLGVRVYVDAVLNHFVGAGNDMSDHRNPNGCVKWGNKTSSAPLDRQSPFYTHAFTYKYNPNTGEPPSQEFPGAAIGPSDFHCDRSLGSWSDLFILNNGWLVGLTDLDTSRETVRERQAAYLVEMISMGVSGFRLDAAKHMSPEDISGIMKKVQTKMGGQLPEDYFVWLEIITGGEAQMIWSGPSWYGSSFNNILMKDLGSQSEIDKIKLWDGLYPKEPQNNPISKNRVVIQNDDHDQQNPGSSSRDMGPFGCVLVKNCPADQHRNFETQLFNSPNGVGNNDNDWPIRFILSSYYLTHSADGIPDGLSDCSLCKVTCESCKHSTPKLDAYMPGECAYAGKGYTRVHRDVAIINSMRKWIKLGPISGSDIGLPGC